MHAGAALAGWQVGSVEEARRAVDAGCDLIVVQGLEAGGHVRGTVALLPLLAVLDVVSVPVVAAGGIATGAGDGSRPRGRRGRRPRGHALPGYTGIRRTP